MKYRNVGTQKSTGGSMRPRMDREEDRLRNTLSIRFTDLEHREICDLAWSKKTSASAMIRGLLLEKLNESKGKN